MLYEFGFKNFFSFREAVSISFRLDANCPTNVSLGRDFTPLICVKGANGSGKTHLLKGLAFLSNFCASSFSSKPEESIGVRPFFSEKGPSEFFIDFSADQQTFRYELSVSKEEVLSETLYRTTARKTKLVERIGNEFSYTTAKLAKLKTMKLRRNASFISTAHQYEFSELAKVRSFFSHFIENVDFGGHADDIWSIPRAAKWLNEHPDYLDFVKTFIVGCDVGISNIEIHKLRDTSDEEEYFPIFYHDVGGKLHAITDVTESSGTKALFRNLVSYQLVLKCGGVLVFDEFDQYLHPHILPKLIDLFLDPVQNPRNAQIIFTTHNTDVLDKLGRYRTYLVNKENNESFAYRLDEIPGDTLRNGRPIISAYNEGKIGGVPKL